MKLRMPKPPISTRNHAFQNVARIYLKQKALKIDVFAGSPESVLGTVDRMIVFKCLQVGHLHRQQVVASEDLPLSASEHSPCGILSLSFDYIRKAFQWWAAHLFDIKNVNFK
jgi:hypothetical protein